MEHLNHPIPPDHHQERHQLMTDNPTTEVAVVHSDGQLSDRMKYAQALASADLLPAAYRKKPANVLLAMEYGHALGLDTVTAMQSVHVIDGKPTASAQLIGALVRRSGHRLRVTGDDKHAVAEIVRHDDPEFVFRAEWTIARAQAANLTGRGPWKQYPAAMLKARAITEVARDACPEALAGVAYTPEELGADGGAWPTETSNPIDPVIDVEEVASEPVTDLATPDIATSAQLKAIAAMLSKCGVKDQDQRHHIVSLILNVDDFSMSTIRKSEAHNIIEVIKPLADADDPAIALHEWLNA